MDGQVFMSWLRIWMCNCKPTVRPALAAEKLDLLCILLSFYSLHPSPSLSFNLPFSGNPHAIHALLIRLRQGHPHLLSFGFFRVRKSRAMRADCRAWLEERTWHPWLIRSCTKRPNVQNFRARLGSSDRCMVAFGGQRDRLQNWCRTVVSKQKHASLLIMYRKLDHRCSSIFKQKNTLSKASTTTHQDPAQRIMQNALSLFFHWAKLSKKIKLFLEIHPIVIYFTFNLENHMIYPDFPILSPIRFL